MESRPDGGGDDTSFRLGTAAPLYIAITLGWYILSFSDEMMRLGVSEAGEDGPLD